MDNTVNKDYNSFASFIKAFKKAIPNFDETKIFFNKKGKVYKGIDVLFVQDRLKKRHLYCSDYHINLWKDHFIEFLETGKFDSNCYYKIFVNSKVLEYKSFPTVSLHDTDYHWYSSELEQYMTKLRERYGKDSGLEQISKSEYLNRDETN